MAVLKIKKNDTVKIIAGKDKGKTGLVKCIDGDRILVGGINLKKKAIRPNPQANEKGGHRSIEHSVHYSNVALFDTKAEAIVKVAVKTLDDGTRVRVNRKNGEKIDGEDK